LNSRSAYAISCLSIANPTILFGPPPCQHLINVVLFGSRFLPIASRRFPEYFFTDLVLSLCQQWDFLAHGVWFSQPFAPLSLGVILPSDLGVLVPLGCFIFGSTHGWVPFFWQDTVGPPHSFPYFEMEGLSTDPCRFFARLFV